MLFKKKPAHPPVPDWKPTIAQPVEEVIACFQRYLNNQRDLVIFENGTCVILPDGLPDEKAPDFAKDVLSKIFNYHPDMNPSQMNDGNILINYNHPAANLVLKETLEKHRAEIEKNHQKALAKSEVLITPLGSNVFDDFGKGALFGRCYMFMDAQNPKIIKIIRKPTTLN